MKIAVSGVPNSGKGLTELTMSHGDESLSWDVSIYSRVTFADNTNIFDCINNFWVTLSDDQQTGIWEVYKLIHSTLQSSREIHVLDQALRALVAQLYSFMPWENIEYWVNYKAEVRIPSSIPAEYGPGQMTAFMIQQKREQERIARKETRKEIGDTDVLIPAVNNTADMNYPRELTYLRKDYQELAILAMALRPMVPIWGEYIRIISEQTGGMFAAYQAIDLLYDTPLPGSVAMQRLLLYMEHSVAIQKQNSHASIVGGLSTTTLPTWLAAGCCVRRIAFGKLQAIEDGDSMIASIYRYVNSTLQSLDGNFGGKISQKTPPAEMNEEDNSSLVDMYKIKQDVRDADLVAQNIYTLRLADMANRVDPTLPVAMVEECLAYMSTIEHQPIHEHQRRLAQWLIKPAISPRGIPFLQKTSIFRVMAVTQAALWHWGMTDLAALVTVIMRSRLDSSMQFGNESRSRVPKELVDQLIVRYPFYIRPKGKDKSTRLYNVAYIAIDEFCNLIGNAEWQLNAPAGIEKHIEAHGTAKKLIIPPDIRTSLAHLMIRLSQR